MSHLAKDMTDKVTWREITPGCNIFEAATSTVVEAVITASFSSGRRQSSRNSRYPRHSCNNLDRVCKTGL